MGAKNSPAPRYRRNVGIMLINGSGQVFVAQRIDSPGPAWQMPQGGIDAGENPRAAALRELEEETSVSHDLVTVLAESAGWLKYDFPADLAARLWNGRFVGQQQRWFLMRYHGTDDQIIIETDHPEFSSWAWVGPGELVEKIVPFKRNIYARVIAEFADYLD